MTAPKRKLATIDLSNVVTNGDGPPVKRRASARASITAAAVNPDINPDIFDAPNATRASPDNDVNMESASRWIKREDGTRSESPLSDAPDVGEPPAKKRSRATKNNAARKMHDSEKIVSAVVDAATNRLAPENKVRGTKKAGARDDAAVPLDMLVKSTATIKDEGDLYDPEVGDGGEANPEEVKEALSRPPPVNSDYLPLPWKGRLGYACLNTYLRNSNPPVFSSRTCRIQSILEHRHPLQDSNIPEHTTQNRPDRSKPVDIALGQRYVENLGIANVRDIAKMIAWNDKYNIRFLRLSSEIFPFASHPEYGYKLAPFASEALADAGKVIAKYGHRVTTHPGQFTQLGSPRKPVIENALRDLNYHDEMLSLLKLPEQQNKDAVMILHMGGVFEGKEATLHRFRDNYKNLSQSVKNRLVLENDDMGWSVHDLLPICEELNIPMVLDFHHNNIVFDSTQMREGTRDIMDLYPRIKATWDRKGIKQKMHYSEPTPAAITPTQRRKHSPRVMTLPPCAPDMDLMIEAKDKEQAVFELMRTFKLPGYDTFNDVIPYTRHDDNKAIVQLARRKKREGEPELDVVAEDEIGMGGPEGRVYWPPGMEEWLRPKKKEVKKKEPQVKTAQLVKKEAKAADAALEADVRAVAADGGKSGEDEGDLTLTLATKKARTAMKKKDLADRIKAAAKAETEEAKRLAKEEAVANKAKRGRQSKQGAGASRADA